jgi:cilia- and flagella-associated protein 57
LEKFKFVLDFKIKELRKEIGPKEEEIAKLRDKTTKRDQKLKLYNTVNQSLGKIIETLNQETNKMQLIINENKDVVRK